MLFTGCRSISPPPNKKEKDTSVCILLPFFSFSPNLLSDQLYGVCECGKGGILPYPKEETAGFSFSCTHTHTHTHTHTLLRLWSLSPGAQEFSDLRAARLGIRARVRPRESRAALLSPPPVAGGPGLSAGRCGAVGCGAGGDWSGWLWAGGLEPCALVGGGWCPPHPSFGSHWPPG